MSCCHHFGVVHLLSVVISVHLKVCFSETNLNYCHLPKLCPMTSHNFHNGHHSIWLIKWMLGHHDNSRLMLINFAVGLGGVCKLWDEGDMVHVQPLSFIHCQCLFIFNRPFFRVMVLDQGLIKEYDSPDHLLKDKSTVFYGMAKAANIVSWLSITQSRTESVYWRVAANLHLRILYLQLVGQVIDFAHLTYIVEVNFLVLKVDSVDRSVCVIFHQFFCLSVIHF